MVIVTTRHDTETNSTDAFDRTVNEAWLKLMVRKAAFGY